MPNNTWWKKLRSIGRNNNNNLRPGNNSEPISIQFTSGFLQREEDVITNSNGDEFSANCTEFYPIIQNSIPLTETSSTGLDMIRREQSAYNIVIDRTQTSLRNELGINETRMGTRGLMENIVVRSNSIEFSLEKLKEAISEFSYNIKVNPPYETAIDAIKLMRWFDDNGIKHRVVEKDGKQYNWEDEPNPERANLTINKGNVTKITYG